MLLSWVIYHLPWWAWAILLAVIWAVLAFLVGTLFGWKYARAMLWPAVALVTAAALVLRARQAGYADRLDEEQKALDRAQDIAQKEREEAQRLPDGELNKRVDKWSR